MLTIRDEQLGVFDAARQRAEVALLADHLARHFPRVAAQHDRATLERRVGEAVADASAYGLTSTRDRARYLNLAATYGWGFDRGPDHAWIRDRLTDPDGGAPGERLAAVVRECVARLAIAAERRAMFVKHLPRGAR